MSVATTVHPSSIVSPTAILGDGVQVGPFCVIGDDVTVGAGTTIMSHVHIDRSTIIGSDVRIHPGAVIGTAPQDLKYDGEPTIASIGDRTVVRECVTINRGTAHSGLTSVGSDVLLMAYTHVAHDCRIGNNVILANSVQLGGHVNVGDWAIIGGVTGVHQFTQIGPHSMVAACVMISKDVPPFTLVGREPVGVQSLNTIGLRRRGFSAQSIDSLDEFYETLYRSGYNISDGLRAYEVAHPTPTLEVQACIAFIRSSKRGVYLSSHA
ncbi:MAG: acyl-ACP--UDP-N-acetylglucosamine O-acyltransferase [bacterium]|nr:acyl-ACP--UDP-N-acetylglucosamine O-acyltransferase [bacterium]